MTNILIIEDDEDMCDELKSILVDEGYTVDVANDGRTGINFTKERAYDVILLDLKLPRMNGYEVLKYLKGEHPNTKVLVLTGSPLKSVILPEDEISIRSREYKKARLELADGIINKPFNVETVISKLVELISKT